jgi:hypothetical protein
LPALAGTALVLAGCTPEIDMQSTRDTIRQGITEQTTLEIAAVTCPETRHARAGDTFECIALPTMGGRLRVAVEQKDDHGNIAWNLAASEGVYDLRAIEGDFEQAVLQGSGVQADVDCGRRWVVGKVGDTFECIATVPGQPERVVVVTVQDEGGDVVSAFKP